MNRKSTILSAAAAIMIACAAVVHAEHLQPRLTPVPDATVPAQQPIPKQPVPQQRPAEPAPGGAEAYPPSTTAATTIGPELLIGCWNLNVDSYLDTRLQLKGKVCEDPAKVECVRNALKANGLNVCLNFQPDCCVTISKSYCGKCEAKSGSWCVKCIDGPELAVLLRSPHGFSKKCLDVTVCDDLHIRVNAPHEIAGVYERAPISVTEVRTGKQGTVPTQTNVPPAPAAEVAP